MPSRYRDTGLFSGLASSQRALAYAELVHREQRRQVDGAPFILHPVEVASLLYRSGARDHLIAAGLLHDSFEKAGVSEAELHRRFGARIAGLVLAVSEDARLCGYVQRKRALRQQVARAGEQALALLAADKISKVRELKLESRPTHTASRDERLAHYRACLVLTQECIPDSPLVPALAAELDGVVVASPSAVAAGVR